jgi:hypothetical protein
MATGSQRTFQKAVRSHRDGCAPTQKKCEGCGATFDCGAPQRGCWCEGTKLDGEAGGKLRAQYADCLCPSCLAAAAVKE